MHLSECIPINMEMIDKFKCREFQGKCFQNFSFYENRKKHIERYQRRKIAMFNTKCMQINIAVICCMFITYWRKIDYLRTIYPWYGKQNAVDIGTNWTLFRTILIHLTSNPSEIEQITKGASTSNTPYICAMPTENITINPLSHSCLWVFCSFMHC